MTQTKAMTILTLCISNPLIYTVFLTFTVDAPHFQQVRIENAYTLDRIAVIIYFRLES